MDGNKICGIFRFTEATLMIRDADLIKNILVKDFTSFHDNDLEINIDTDPMFGRNPFVLRGEKWKITRSQLVPAFTVAKLKQQFPLVLEVCKDLKEHIEKSKTDEFEAKEICACFTTNVVASCAFGINGNAIQDPESEFRQMGREIIDISFINNVKFLLLFVFPKLADILKIRVINSNVENFFRRLVKETVTYREKNNVNRTDYLQHLINLKNKAGDSDAANGHAFMTDDVAAQAITFFLDGFETSSGALSFALYCMATNRDVQSRVREEVKSVMDKHGGQLTFEAVQEMTYLDMAFSESLRLYPPVMFITRVCTKPFKLEKPGGGTFEVEVGTRVLIPVLAIHHDPQYYPNPKTYDPNRFSEENKKNIKYVNLSFGDGPRICLGARFAQMQVKAGLAYILSNFEVLPQIALQYRYSQIPASNFLLRKEDCG